MNVDHLISTYGYVAVFVLVAVESLGIPLPGETALIAAATYAGAHSGGGSHHAHLAVWGIFAVGAAAAVIGDTAGYWIGDVGGFRLLRRYGRYVRLDEPKVKVARYLFARHGGKVVFFGRFVSVLRTYAAFLAGTTKMRYRRFLGFNASGGILWAGVYTFAAYYAGAGLSKVSTPVDIALGVTAALVILAGILVMRRRFSQLQEVAEKAFPGPLYSDTGHAGRRRDRSPDRQDGEDRDGEGPGGGTTGRSAPAGAPPAGGGRESTADATTSGRSHSAR